MTGAMFDADEAVKRLVELRSEHRKLDERIADLAGNPPYDPIKLQRLKKRKLQTKDEITYLENALLPDIIA